MHKEIGKFFDINKLPKDYGILVFPISISRAEHKNGQSPEECFEYVKHFSPTKVAEPKIGLNMIYGDFLYFHSKEKANILKHKFMNVVLKHKNTFAKLIQKSFHDFQIQHAFSYGVWNQLYLSFYGDFVHNFALIKKEYEKDKNFQKYIKDDAKYCKRKLTKEQIDFFLEEHLMLYFLSKKKVGLHNEYILGREKWVLWCYPGIPLKSMVYIYQKNFFKLDAPENQYQNHVYDLESKKIINILEIDLEKYNYEY